MKLSNPVGQLLNAPHKGSPPSDFMIRFIRLFCPDNLFEEIEGDLIERFQCDVKDHGEGKAKRRFAWNVIRFSGPE